MGAEQKVRMVADVIGNWRFNGSERGLGRREEPRLRRLLDRNIEFVTQPGRDGRVSEVNVFVNVW